MYCSIRACLVTDPVSKQPSRTSSITLLSLRSLFNQLSFLSVGYIQLACLPYTLAFLLLQRNGIMCIVGLGCVLVQIQYRGNLLVHLLCTSLLVLSPTSLVEVSVNWLYSFGSLKFLVELLILRVLYKYTYKYIVAWSNLL